VGNRRDDRNLLELKPLRNLEWEEGENGTVVLLVPKFRNSWMRRFVGPQLSKPNFRVKTDPLGTFVWRRCDGNTTVHEIAGEMGREFGPDFDPSFERISRFVRQLAKNDFILFQE
jgi:hypothetical protein